MNNDHDGVIAPPCMGMGGSTRSHQPHGRQTGFDVVRDTHPRGHGDAQMIGPLQDMTSNADRLVDHWPE
ncbi:MAG: hypothetical protein HUJ24_02735 [Rhodobacteraceae bacterium]|nr:hypothetical protein [Paracoccaceae bacterium]